MDSAYPYLVIWTVVLHWIWIFVALVIVASLLCPHHSKIQGNSGNNLFYDYSFAWWYWITRSITSNITSRLNNGHDWLRYVNWLIAGYFSNRGIYYMVYFVCKTLAQ